MSQPTSKYLAREIARAEKQMQMLGARIERAMNESAEKLRARTGPDEAAYLAIKKHLDELVALRDGGTQ